MQNKVVAGLIDKKIAVEQEENPLTVSELDERIAPDDLAIPLSADSSQMLAIAEAAKGKVLYFTDLPEQVSRRQLQI